MNRVNFQSLSNERISDASALLNAERWAGSYYISGYAVECAIKACIAAKTQKDEFPPKDAAKYYVHDLSKLLDLAGLQSSFQAEAERDPAFSANWAVVKDWSEEARYDEANEREAREIHLAITEPNHGVLQWLRKNW